MPRRNPWAEMFDDMVAMVALAIALALFACGAGLVFGLAASVAKAVM